MKITQRQLDELIRLITKGVLKEWSSLSGDDGKDMGSADDGVKPADAQTSAEKSKEKHDRMIANKKELDMAKQQQTTNKEKATSYKSQYDQWKRFEKSNDDKAVKDLSAKVANRGSN